MSRKTRWVLIGLGLGATVTIPAVTYFLGVELTEGTKQALAIGVTYGLIFPTAVLLAWQACEITWGRH